MTYFIEKHREGYIVLYESGYWEGFPAIGEYFKNKKEAEAAIKELENNNV